jgi:hypothetical protein
MSWLARASMASVLALAVFALPLVLDQCAASCEAHQISAANGARPACHHSLASTRRMEPRPTSCGHDHSAASATVVLNTLASERGTVSAVAVVPSLQSLAPRMIGRIDFLGISPGSLATPHDRSLPLRI